MINAFQNVITITRGDDAVISIDITDIMGNEYELETGDTVTMYVKKPADGTLENQEIIFQKTFDDNNSISIDSADTADLAVGTYKYGVKLAKANGKVATIISPTDFIVEEGIE